MEINTGYEERPEVNINGSPKRYTLNQKDRDAIQDMLVEWYYFKKTLKLVYGALLVYALLMTILYFAF